MTTKHIKISPKVTDPVMKNKNEQVLVEDEDDIKDLIFDSPQKTKEEESFFSYDNRFLVIIFAIAIVALFLLVIYMYYKSDDKAKEEEMLKNNMLLPEYPDLKNYVYPEINRVKFNEENTYIKQENDNLNSNECSNERSNERDNRNSNNSSYFSDMNAPNKNNVNQNVLQNAENNMLLPEYPDLKNYVYPEINRVKFNAENQDIPQTVATNMQQNSNTSQTPKNNEINVERNDNVRNEINKPVLLNTSEEVDKILNITSKLIE